MGSLRQPLLWGLTIVLLTLPLLTGPGAVAAPTPTLTPTPTPTPTPTQTPSPTPTPIPTPSLTPSLTPTPTPTPAPTPSPTPIPTPSLTPSLTPTPTSTPTPSPTPTPTPTPEPTPEETREPATPRAIQDDKVGGLWLSQGGEGGWLGAPRMPLFCGLARGGCYQHFAGGSIYWTQGTGAHAVRGAIQDRWGGLGWEKGRLGYPISGEFCGLRDGGCGQRFQGGLILWSPDTGAHPVWGAILGRYSGEPFENGRLGYPTSGEFCGLRDGGCGQRFAGGYVYYHRSAGTHAVLGAIRSAYAGSNWEAGPLGYPTSEEFCGLVQAGCGQRFQKGIILWTMGTGAHPVRGAILDQYARQGYERGALGYPRAAETIRGRNAVQPFQNGQLSFSFAAREVNLVKGGYPDHDATPCGDGLWCKFGYKYSPRGFAYRNCTDFVAWRKGMVWSEINGEGDGNARGWRQGWLERGREVSNVPRVGSIAWWGTSRGGGYGHVAIVVAVNRDGSVNVEHYNYDVPGGYTVSRNLRAEAYLH